MTRRLESGQVLAARFELVRPLQAGERARTWLARDIQSGRDVVVKSLRDDESARAIEVERALRGVMHAALRPALERIHDDAGWLEIADYLRGGEIGRLRGRPWPFIIRRLLPVIDALAHLHDTGLVHGDLKTANVLLDDDGLAHLVDFGSAQPAGAPDRVAGSPYAMSPERHDGAAPAVADDVYAVGVLLYELISGHPPFYPDLTPQRVREEAPAALSGRPTPPGSLCTLVANCLAKAPADRPASMREVQARLAQCLAEASAAELPIAAQDAGAAWTLRPPPEAVPIQARWQRQSSEGVASVDELRRDGFRRGLLASALVVALLAAGFTFLVLPDLVASRTEAPTAASAPTVVPPAPAPAVAADLEQLAQLKRSAEARRELLPERIKQLESQDAARWGAGGLARVRSDLLAGDASLARREYAAALAQFGSAATGLDALEKQRPEALSAALRQAGEAFGAGRAAEAAAAYASALRIDSGNTVARTGVERSKVLDEVLRETALGARAEQAGDTVAAAAAYERALQLDPASRGARESLARLRSRATGEAFASAMAQAHGALARRDYVTAQGALQRADRIRPGTPEVTEGLQQVRVATETKQLSQLIATAVESERAERWSEAVALYRQALQGDANLRAAQEGLERSEPRAMLGAELQSIIERPDRLFSPAGREVARNVLGQAEAAGATGMRMQQQLERVRELLRQAETPIRVALASDNVTDVQVYRVGKLGPFEHRDLELMPGRYTVVGTRAGYRDVRKELNLLPGTAPPLLTIRCEERI